MTSRNPNKTEIAAAVENVRKAWLANNWVPISIRQQQSLKDPGVRGPMWVSRVSLPAPGDNDLLQVIVDAIEGIGNGTEKFVLPTISQNLQAQWTGYRSGVGHTAAEPLITEREKYRSLMQEVTSPTTILYVFGGAFYLYGPASCRGNTSKLAKLTGGRCFTVAYRLAPQNPFPAALLDVLVGYLTLLYPPEASYHGPVHHSRIAFAGDSGGASICLSLIQLILELRRQQNTEKPIVRFHGQRVELCMPGGVALASAGLDQTYSLPSWFENGETDILQAEFPALGPDFPICPIWPASPPRGSFYCETSMLCHPLVSPTIARNWAGSPPMWFAQGRGERLVDASKFVAQNAARQNVPVEWEEYEGMPHLWFMLFKRWEQAEMCMYHWADACSRFTKGVPIATMGILIRLHDLDRAVINVHVLTTLTMNEVDTTMRRKQATVRAFTGEGNPRAKL